MLQTGFREKRKTLLKITIHHAVFAVLNGCEQMCATPLPDYLAGRNNATGLE